MDACAAMRKGIVDSKCINYHLYCVDHVINNSLKAAFGKPIVSDFIKRIKELSAWTHYSLRRIRLIRRKCKEMKGAGKFCLQ